HPDLLPRVRDQPPCEIQRDGGDAGGTQGESDPLRGHTYPHQRGATGHSHAGLLRGQSLAHPPRGRDGARHRSGVPPLRLAHDQQDAADPETVAGPSPVHLARTSRVERAISLSSSVGMTLTVTGLPTRVITSSFASFRATSRWRPRNSSPSTMRARMVAECSPIPPAKTSASRPPNDAAKAPMVCFTR